MARFYVVDLASQAHAVATSTRGWWRERVLAWLSRYGQVTQIYENNADLYTFRSPSGLWTGFILSEDGEFYLIADHTTYRIA